MGTSPNQTPFYVLGNFRRIVCDLCATCVLLFFVVSCFVLICAMHVWLSLAYLLLSLYSVWACSVRVLLTIHRGFTNAFRGTVSLQASDAPVRPAYQTSFNFCSLSPFQSLINIFVLPTTYIFAHTYYHIQHTAHDGLRNVSTTLPLGSARIPRADLV